mmetsp:Transcript_27665/g.32742  ORF Transcript_27665/g.32742 Transcript_27665/m.32742 type:complete len:464 (+) Transcript_27665:1860-3251(+)
MFSQVSLELKYEIFSLLSYFTFFSTIMITIVLIFQVFVQLPSAGGSVGIVLSIDVNIKGDSISQVYQTLTQTLGGDNFWIEDSEGNRIRNQKGAKFKRTTLNKNTELTPLFVAYGAILISLDTIVGFYDIQIGAYDDVAALKAAIYHQTTISIEDQQLFISHSSNGNIITKLKELNDPYRWLSSIGIESGTILKLVVTPDYPKNVRKLPLHPVLASLQKHSSCSEMNCEWIINTSHNAPIKSSSSCCLHTFSCQKCHHILSLHLIEESLIPFGLGKFCHWIQHSYHKHIQYGSASLDKVLGEYVLKIEYGQSNIKNGTTAAGLKKEKKGTTFPPYSEIMRFKPPQTKGCAGGDVHVSQEVIEMIKHWSELCHAVRCNQTVLDAQDDDANHIETEEEEEKAYSYYQQPHDLTANTLIDASIPPYSSSSSKHGLIQDSVLPQHRQVAPLKRIQPQQHSMKELHNP